MVQRKSGTVAIYLHTTDNGFVKILLKNTLLIPCYPQNIFSVQFATKNGAILNFKEN